MYPIDFVVTWVDDSDKAWRKEKAKYNPEEETDTREERYRDWGFLRYWFRAVEKFAPWVRTVHFVTCGHLPEWLNTECPKLHIVKHEDYIPKEFLPTFNCNVIENCMYRIEGLAEHFVYFNDDFFLINHAKPDDFFKDGKPCDMLAFQPVVANPYNPVMSHMLLNNSLVLCKYFNKRENVRNHPGNYFKIGYPALYFFYNLLEMAFPLYTGLYTVHGPSPFLKSTFEAVWEKEEKTLTKMCANRFRHESDLTQYLFREWQKLENNFVPMNVQRNFKYFGVSTDNKKLIRTITTQKVKQICINDTTVQGDCEQIGREIREAFEKILPEASSFEK